MEKGRLQFSFLNGKNGIWSLAISIVLRDFAIYEKHVY
jgi:hypothetical protein